MSRAFEIAIGIIAAIVVMVACSMGVHAGEAVATPNALLAFCDRNPLACGSSSPASARVDQARVIIDTNRDVNAWISPHDDLTNPALHYTLDRRDRWDIAAPGSLGDCDDYALTKWFVLLWKGVPAGAMRFAIVGVGGLEHLILIVRIGSIEYALDYLNPNVLPADQLKWRWQQISAEGSPLIWSAIEGAPK